MKAFVINLDTCVGCYGCQIGCKDEHCDNNWMPYAMPQPDIGQFWMRVLQEERGARPHVTVTYTPVLCQHCEEAPCMAVAKDGAVYRRDDGLVLIDPAKAKGQRQIVDACPYHCVFWNEELNLPQKCTGCAHLIDRGWPIDVPRCFDNCPNSTIQFGDESELDLEGTEVLHPEYGTKPRVFYRGLPKRFVAGTLYDPLAKEIVEGARVSLKCEQGEFSTVTDNYGDFWIKGLPKADFTLKITAGSKEKTLQVSTLEKDIGLGDVPLG